MKSFGEKDYQRIFTLNSIFTFTVNIAIIVMTSQWHPAGIKCNINNLNIGKTLSLPFLCCGVCVQGVTRSLEAKYRLCTYCAFSL